MKYTEEEIMEAIRKSYERNSFNEQYFLTHLRELIAKNICVNCYYFNDIKKARGFCLLNNHYTFTISYCNDFKKGDKV